MVWKSSYVTYLTTGEGRMKEAAVKYLVCKWAFQIREQIRSTLLSVLIYFIVFLEILEIVLNLDVNNPLNPVCLDMLDYIDSWADLRQSTHMFKSVAFTRTWNVTWEEIELGRKNNKSNTLWCRENDVTLLLETWFSYFHVAFVSNQLSRTELGLLRRTGAIKHDFSGAQ